MLCRAIIMDNEEHEEWLFGHSFADYRSMQNQIAPCKTKSHKTYIQV